LSFFHAWSDDVAETSTSLELPLERVDTVTCRHCFRRVTAGNWPLLATVPCPHCSRPLNVYGKLGPFLVQALLSRSPICWVFEGVEPNINQPVVLQVWRHDTAEGDNLKQLISHFKHLARAPHPNLMKVLSLGQTKEVLYVVMESVGPQRLKTFTETAQPLEEEQALRIALGIAQGLGAAASVKALHGDLQPDHIALADSDGRAAVMNLGMDLLGQKLTAAGKVWASPLYIAPEKVRGQPHTIQSDMFSLGCILFQLLAGKPPYMAANNKELLTARLHPEPPPIEAVRSDLSAAAVAVVTRLMQTKPAHRYGDYASLEAELQSAIDSGGQDAPIVFADAPTPERFIPGGAGALRRDGARAVVRDRRTPMNLVLGLLVLAALVGVVIFIINHADGFKPPPPVQVIKKKIPRPPDVPDSKPDAADDDAK
jgi:serine/threonine protein kinase